MWDVGTIYVERYSDSCLSLDWEIENYFQRRPSDDAYYQSPKFSCGESTWRLRLYPNGDSNRRTVGNVGLYLEKLHSSIEPNKVNFTMGIKYEDDTEYLSHQFVYRFRGCNNLCGFGKIASRWQLFRDRKTLTPKKKLKVFVNDLVVDYYRSIFNWSYECSSKLTDKGSSENSVKKKKSPQSDTKDKGSSENSDKKKKSHPADTKDKGSSENSDKKKKSHPPDTKGERKLEEAKNGKVNSPSSNIKGEVNLEDITSEKKDSPPSDIEGGGNVEDNENKKTDSPPSDIEGQENSEEIQNEGENSPPSDIEGVEILARNLKDLFLNEEECDVTFKVEGQEFHAHRVLLVARSSVFASMFRHDMSEKNTGIVNVADCGAEAFGKLLLYLYSGAVKLPELDITFDLYEASVKYDLEHLKRKCIHFMKQDMSVDTFCDILAISLKHNEIKLIKTATEYFAEHIKDILPTLKWQTFMKENHIAANELLMKSMESK